MPEKGLESSALFLITMSNEDCKQLVPKDCLNPFDNKNSKRLVSCTTLRTKSTVARTKTSLIIRNHFIS